MEIKKVRAIIEKLLTNEKYSLYDLKKKRQFGYAILEVVVDGENLTVAVLTKLNELILNAIDDYLPDNYYLEVSSPGAERALRTLAEAEKYVGSKIKIVSDRYNDVGVLEKVEKNLLFVKINIKGRYQTIEVPFEELNKVNLAV
ncbi:MAG: hypothetical protein RBS76_00435 [Acholeplasmatales bacterium]|jgi:ribosome maturation factor RimP|nr:hypothetical protein [Acholeplasmataceae bacterium]MDY0114945.1 hypothetical protein [Acholeplasmatales bacterium]HHT39801.1 hypothetical protein [Acholeplasmataceae bacterium]